MIKTVTIQGYKSVREQTVDLHPINVLIGGNGTGKSNFISVFELIRNLYYKNLQNYVIIKGGADSLLYMGKKVTDNICIDMYFSERDNAPHNRFIVNFGEARDSLYIKSIETSFRNGTRWYPQQHESNAWETTFMYQKWGQAFFVNDYMKQFEVYHFHDTGDRSPVKGKCNVDDNKNLRKDGSGEMILEALKINDIRAKCPHFNDWLTKLEAGLQNDWFSEL